VIPLQVFQPDDEDGVAVLVHGRETVLLTAAEAEEVAGLLTVVAGVARGRCPDPAIPDEDLDRCAGGCVCTLAEKVVAGSGDVLLCDGCFEAVRGLPAECQDGCSRPLDHVGACHMGSLDDPACDRCGGVDRLTPLDVEDLDEEERVRLLVRAVAEDDPENLLQRAMEAPGDED
jgi:hypothetical protein